MRFLVRAALLLVALGAIGLLGVAFLADLPAPVREISVPVETR
jgi:hypothetical protein